MCSWRDRLTNRNTNSRPNIHRSTQYSASRRRSKNVTFDVLKCCTRLYRATLCYRALGPICHGPVCVCLCQNVHLSRVGVLLKWLKGSSCFLTWRFFPPVVYHKCKKKRFFTFFYKFWSRFLRFLMFSLFSKRFLFKKRWQSSERQAD